jgi:putative spermidine/putrescine transport system ATP-binding protein
LPRQLSGGQQQRVALARALVYEPEILLLDEPLSALDKKLRGDLQWELRQLNKESGASFLYVTHDQEEALSMSDRIAIFNHGRIVQIGTPTELYQSPSNLFVAGFLGRSNVLPATVQRTDADSVVVESEAGVMGVPRRAHQVRSVGEKVSVVIRPHQIRLASPGGPGLAARVEAISYGGNMMTYRLRTNQGTELYTECVVGEVNSEALQVGSQVSMQFDMKNVNVLEAMSAA